MEKIFYILYVMIGLGFCIGYVGFSIRKLPDFLLVFFLYPAFIAFDLGLQMQTRLDHTVDTNRCPHGYLNAEICPVCKVKGKQ